MTKDQKIPLRNQRSTKPAPATNTLKRNSPWDEYDDRNCAEWEEEKMP